MTPRSAGQELLTQCHRLVELVTAQGAALTADDYAWFEALATERELLQLQLTPLLATPLSEPCRRLLLRVAALDRQHLALNRALLDETGRSLKQLQRGHSALAGYARPGGVAGSVALLDCAS